MRSRIVNYVSLTKPRVVLLFAVTGITAMVVEGFAWRRPVDMGLVLLAIILTASSANALNQYLERDLDAAMARTRNKRPLPRGVVTPRQALVFGVALGVGAVAVLALSHHLLSAALALFTILFYAVVYTIWLKPRTPYNIVIGGIAGAMAPLIGWTAATGHLAPLPVLLFLIVFVWTPPHFWALALWAQEDYRAAKIPMLPVVYGDARTLGQILGYTLLLFPLTLLLIPLQPCGWIYGSMAIILGVVFIWKAVVTWWTGTRDAAYKLFGYSIFYLLALFISMMIDALFWT